jgi:DNA-directed RNA polymerase specialized sigma24 family protein
MTTICEKQPAVRKIADRGIFIEELYQNCLPEVAAFVRKRNGSLDDANDIFHDALVIYYEKMVSGNLEISASAEAYVFGISKHLWTRKFEGAKKTVSLSYEEAAITIPPDRSPSPETSRLLILLESAGQKCLNLLRSFYYDNESLENIARLFGFGGARSATVQKFKCLEKMRDEVKSRSLQYDDFFE